MDTPSQLLAAKIISKLIEEGLVTKAASKRLVGKLSEGKLRAEDWRLSLELAPEKEAKK